MRRDVPIHYLRPNDTVWTPPAVICFDTETRWCMDGDNERHTIRLWVARFTDRRTPKNVQPRDDYARGVTGEDLAHQIHAWFRNRSTVWMYAHNLNFDLTVTSLPQELGLLGWHMTDFAIDCPIPFARFERGSKHLTVTDSFSWMPVRLADIGHAVGFPKPALPADDDSEITWLRRCRSDVTILSQAMLTLMNWWDVNKLGRWSVTGNSSGWNAMRHSGIEKRIVIDPDPEKLAADRRAIYGGRRGQWHAGKLPPGRYAELDLEHAYPTVCRDLPLPLKRIHTFTSLPPDDWKITSDRFGIIAQVVLDTDVPRWPVRISRRVWYPTGRFTTVLAGPEIAEAARLGCLVAIGPGEVHQLGYALRPWAIWCLAGQADTTGAVPDVAKIVLKHWGRAIIGKWAQRSFVRVELGPAPTAGLDCAEGWHHTAGVRAHILDYNGTRWQVSASEEGENSYPAILAFVESYVRVALGRALDALGPDLLISCDTDGMLTMCNQPSRIGAAIDAARPFTLREKRAYRYIEAIGPQHTVLDGRRRFAGVPASAQDLSDGRLHAWLWPKLAWQVRHGRPGEYVRPSQTYRISGTYAPGWVLAGGAVTAVEARNDAAGCPGIVPWPETALARSGAVLGPVQNPRLTVFSG